MTEANAVEEVENAAAAVPPSEPDVAAPAEDTAPAASPPVEEPVAKTPEPPTAPPAAPDHAKIAVTHIGPEIVEPVPPRDLQLPDTPEIQRIRRLEVPIIVRLATRVMPLGEIVQLAPGAIIEFSKTVNENLDLMISNKCIGCGQAVKVGEKFGLKVTNLTTLDQMIRAMAGR